MERSRPRTILKWDGVKIMVVKLSKLDSVARQMVVSCPVCRKMDDGEYQVCDIHEPMIYEL